MNQYIQKNNIRTINNIWHQIFRIDGPKSSSLRKPSSLRWYDMYHDHDYFDVNEYIDLVEKTNESLGRWNDKEVTVKNILLDTIEFNEGSVYELFTCKCVEEIYPIFNSAVSLEKYLSIIKPESVPHLCSFLKIIETSKNRGVELENHGVGDGFGFHFHYGRISKDKLERSNILLTYHPLDTKEGKDPDMFAEYHGKNTKHNWIIDAIGENKRSPIYSVCLPHSKKKGIENFRKKSADAKLFFVGPEKFK